MFYYIHPVTISSLNCDTKIVPGKSELRDDWWNTSKMLRNF